jgi:hypothetical protein
VRLALLVVVSTSLAATTTLEAQYLERSGAGAPALTWDSTSAPQAARPAVTMRVHRTLGTVALASFATALVTGAASGNLGKLMDPATCCPDGGTRNQSVRSFDRKLVTLGILSYTGAASLAAYNMTIGSPPSANPRTQHKAHRWLALAHGSAFVVSAVTGAGMKRAQESDPAKFARLAKVHVAANVAFVPLLTAAFSNILFELSPSAP